MCELTDSSVDATMTRLAWRQAAAVMVKERQGE